MHVMHFPQVTMSRGESSGSEVSYFNSRYLSSIAYYGFVDLLALF